MHSGHTEPHSRLPPYFLLCKIPSLKLAVVLLPDIYDIERFLVHIESLDEQCQDASMDIRVNKRHVKVQYDKSILLDCMSRVTWSSCMIKTKKHWGQTSLNPCGTVLTSCDVF
jgi:hypothetical protein